MHAPSIPQHYWLFSKLCPHSQKKQTPNTHPIMHLNTQIAQNTPVHMYTHTTKNSPALSHSSKHNHTPTYPKINLSTLQYQFWISYWWFSPFVRGWVRQFWIFPSDTTVVFLSERLKVISQNFLSEENRANISSNSK